MHEILKISVFEGPKQSPGFLLWHMSTAWRSSIEAVLKPLGLTHPQFVILASTSWLVSSTQIAIGKMAALDPNTTSQIIKGLEKRKLVKRVPSGRVKNVSLTTGGSDLVKKALPAVEKADLEFFGILSSKDLNSLIQIFTNFQQR